MELVTSNGTKIHYSVEDHSEISKHRWTITIKGYCSTYIEGRGVLMHRLIMKCPGSKIVDHIDGIKTNNRRENLRITDMKGNSQNKRKLTGKSSQYIGVSFDKKLEKYAAKIKVDGYTTYIGSYETELEAAVARDLYIVHMIKDSLFNLNFPDSRDMYSKILYTPRVTVRHKKKQTISSICEKIEGRDDIVRLTIPSATDIVVIIDAEDYDRIKFFSYCISNGYVVSENHRLHRFLMNETDPNIFIDHIDNNPYNNSKKNLRRSNAKMNAQNQQKRKNTTSKYVGVYYSKSTHKWRSMICVDGKRITVGSFGTEEGAARARDEYIKTHLRDSHFPLSF